MDEYPTQKMTSSEAQAWLESATGVSDIALTGTFPESYSAPKDVVKGEFIRIIPDSDGAMRAFSDLCQLKAQGRLDPHNAKFIIATGSDRFERPGITHAYEAESVTTGHFTIGWHVLSVSGPRKWKIGTSLQEVDILLAFPEALGSDRIAPVHVTLRLNEQSGVWNLKAGASMKVDKEQLLPDGSICLSRYRTRLWLNGLTYIVEFVVTDAEQEKLYIEERNRMFPGKSISRSKFSGLPFNSDIRLPFAVFRRGLGSGTFGFVFEGFEPIRGDPRVIKRLPLANQTDADEAAQEVRALHTLRGCTGIVTMHGIADNEGRPEFPKVFPSDLYIVQQRGIPFNGWQEVMDEGVWDRRARHMHSLLMGVYAFHVRGWMHRDITTNNLLYAVEKGEMQPSKAMLCDFGKVGFTRTDIKTHLAAFELLPPEIRRPPQVQDKSYTHKIDIWMLGLALIQHWWPQARSFHPRVQDQWNQLILRLKNEKGSPLVQFLVKMLQWKPELRPEARDILRDTDFKHLIPFEVWRKGEEERDELYKKALKEEEEMKKAAGKAQGA